MTSQKSSKEEGSHEDEERFVTTPKGIAVFAMLECGLIQSIEDPRVNGFWRMFEQDMRRSGYVVEE